MQVEVKMEIDEREIPEWFSQAYDDDEVELMVASFVVQHTELRPHPSSDKIITDLTVTKTTI
jgi:hypothetical protein